MSSRQKTIKQAAATYYLCLLSKGKGSLFNFHTHLEYKLEEFTPTVQSKICGGCGCN